MTEQRVELSLELTRAFFEGRGDDFMTIIAECVDRGIIAISEAAAQRLFDTVRSAASSPRDTY